MYQGLKKVAGLFIPKKFLKKNESSFRKLISLLYIGSKCQCNICNIKLNRFVNYNSSDLLCPNCGSRSRTRRLDKILRDKEILKGNVLHFSPPKSLYKKFKELSHLNYFSSDFVNQFTADYNFDITSIKVENNFFDVIICYHILEHIMDDKKAMEELYRVLKPSGICYIQTPYKDGEIYEDSSIISEKERKIAFGQEDHVRIYSIKELEKRLQNVKFKTQIETYNEYEYYGFLNEEIIICKKTT
jgi:SAM-dependent methyltransferase